MMRLHLFIIVFRQFWGTKTYALRRQTLLCIWTYAIGCIDVTSWHWVWLLLFWFWSLYRNTLSRRSSFWATATPCIPAQKASNSSSTLSLLSKLRSVQIITLNHDNRSQQLLTLFHVVADSGPENESLVSKLFSFTAAALGECQCGSVCIARIWLRVRELEWIAKLPVGEYLGEYFCILDR